MQENTLTSTQVLFEDFTDIQTIRQMKLDYGCYNEHSHMRELLAQEVVCLLSVS